MGVSMEKNNDSISQALFAAYYQLTMAQAYWEHSQTAESTFSLFIRRYPKNRGYLVFSGVEDILNHLENLKFNEKDIAYLKSLNHFSEPFLEYLGNLRFSGSVRSIKEGSIFFPEEPVLEITAPLIEAQIIENFVLNRVNVESVLTTKASRVMYAAKDKKVSEFGSRRTHGLDAADKLVRAGTIVGFESTGNIHGAAKYGQKVSGTMGHSFITSFESEIEAFRAYARSFPNSSTFLVDTFDTILGTKNAIKVALEMREEGNELTGIRLDSGDFGKLAKEVRSLLDQADLKNVKIIISGDLDEHIIEHLLEIQAPIDSFGVGTRIGTSSDAPSIDCVYKLVEYNGIPVLKLSPGKETIAGRKQIYRFLNKAGLFEKDLLALESENPSTYPDGYPLLEEVFKNGERVKQSPTLQNLKDHFTKSFEKLPAEYKHLTTPAIYPVSISEELTKLQRKALKRADGSQAEPNN
jgi:nicotinate phosphoribosyltransferase